MSLDLAQVCLVAEGLFPQQVCLCHRESLDRKALQDPRVTLDPLDPLDKG